MATGVVGSGPMNKCGDCGGEVKNNEKALECDLCDRWVHIKCSGVPDDIYKVMKKRETSVKD